MYGSLPKNEQTFHLEIVGNDTGLKYEGSFTVRCILDMSGKHAMELEQTRLQADFKNPTDGLQSIAFTLAYLRAHVLSGAEWWKSTDLGSKCLDENALVVLFNKVSECENNWKNELRKQVEVTKPAPETLSPKANP